MLTCKQFLQELNDYLDESIDIDLKLRLQAHVNACPNCFVIVDTTRRTLEVYKGMEPQSIPDKVRDRLWAALEKKMAKKMADEAAEQKPPAAKV